MLKYTVAILLIAMVLCCSTLAYPATQSNEFTPIDEGKVHRDEDKMIKDHEDAFGKDENAVKQNEENENALKNKTFSSKNHESELETEVDKEVDAYELVVRMMSVQVALDFSDSLSDLEEKRLQGKLMKAAVIGDWHGVDDFIRYCIKSRLEAAGEGFDFQKTDFPKNSIHSVMYSSNQV